MNWIDESIEKLRPRVITYSERWEHMRNVLQPILDEWYKEFEPALRTAITEAHTKGVEEGRRERDEKDIKTLTELSIETGNQEYVERAKRKLIQQGTQEALAKVEEWVKDYVERWGKLYTDDMADDLLHHLQQLKDNKV